MEPEVTTSCCQVELLVEAAGTLTHKTFNPKCVLPSKSLGIKIKQRLRKWQPNDLAQLVIQTHPIGMILCYAYRQELETKNV